MQIGQVYKIQSEVSEDDGNSKARRIYIPAKLIKEFPNFYLFKTKHYRTTILKKDYKINPTLIREV